MDEEISIRLFFFGLDIFNVGFHKESNLTVGIDSDSEGKLSGFVLLQVFDDKLGLFEESLLGSGWLYLEFDNLKLFHDIM